MQPPLIPHDTRGYEVNLQVNKCMSCHARRRAEESQALMISVTHYMDCDGNFLAEVSPRRYFCNQCHVTQTNTREVVKSDFKDMDDDGVVDDTIHSSEFFCTEARAYSVR